MHGASPQRRIVALGLLGLSALAGCATPQATRLAAEPPSGLPPIMALDVPFFPQARGHCGPASLAMALTYSGDPVAPAELAAWTYTPGADGSFQIDLQNAVARRGRLAYPVRSLRDVMGELAAGRPVVVFQNLAYGWWPRWHYAVSTGYDLGRATLRLHTGTRRNREISLALFERTWARAGYWALIVLPPGELPVSADEREYLLAAAGLERAERWRAAETAYVAAARSWPQSGSARVGLGNARYAQGDLAGAEAAFRDAVRADPDTAPAWNNLALLLLRRGQRDEALAAVERALELGGPLLPVYQRTREEIEASPR